MSSSATLLEALRRLRRYGYDETGWRNLFDSLAPRAKIIAFRLLGGNESAAEDVAQEAFEKLIQLNDFNRFTTASEVGAYFYSIVHNLAIDALRKQRGSSPFPLVDLAPDDFEAIDGERVDPATSAAALQWFTHDALKQLGPHLTKRDEVVLRFVIMGYSGGEIASELSVTESNAFVIVHRLRMKLKKVMEDT